MNNSLFARTELTTYNNNNNNTNVQNPLSLNPPPSSLVPDTAVPGLIICTIYKIVRVLIKPKTYSVVYTTDLYNTIHVYIDTTTTTTSFCTISVILFILRLPERIIITYNYKRRRRGLFNRRARLYTAQGTSGRVISRT